MEYSAGCGLLGRPEEIRCAGCLVCTVTQQFSRIVLNIPAAVLAHWSGNSLHQGSTVEFQKDIIRILGRKGVLILEALVWEHLDPNSCSWQIGCHGDLIISAEKDVANWGSWPYALQSLVLAAPAGDQKVDCPPSLQILWSYDKQAFEKAAENTLQSHLEEARVLRAAFVSTVFQQLASSGPPGQVAIHFPSPGPHCIACLINTRHLPSVQKLLRLAHEKIGFSINPYDAAAVASPGAPDIFSRDLVDSIIACFLAGLAALEQRRAVHGISSVQVISTCYGSGVGEYAAAVFGGALQLSDALNAVAVLAEYTITDHGEGSQSRVLDAMRSVLHNAEIGTPRLRIYSGADAALYSTPEQLRHLLPRAALASASQRHWGLVHLALMQQGVAEIIEAVPSLDNDDCI